MRDKSGRFEKFINEKEKCLDYEANIFGLKIFWERRRISPHFRS